jgi:hypothetical protein
MPYELSAVIMARNSETLILKPSEQPQSKPKTKLVRFHCGYCVKEGHKDDFCFKKKREERMAKEWTNKDRYNPSHSVPKPRMPLAQG